VRRRAQHTVRNYVHGGLALKWRPVDPRDPLTRGAAPSTAVRLFRRRRAYRHRGLVHQTVAPAIRERGGNLGRHAANPGRPVEDGSTPNGVFGSALHGADLLDVAGRLGAASSAAPRDVARCLAAAFPNLRYVWIADRAGDIPAGDAVWPRFFAESRAEPIGVSSEVLRRDPRGTVRRVLRRLGIAPLRALLVDRQP
jgi:LPS sulfotransferase NodH